jgi:hypothetical protein
MVLTNAHLCCVCLWLGARKSQMPAPCSVVSGCLLTRVSSLRPLFEKHPFFVLRIMRFTVALLSFGYASGARVHRVDDSPSGDDETRTTMAGKAKHIHASGLCGHHEQLCEGKEYGVCLGAEDGVAITQPCSESANRWLYNNPHGSATLRLDGGDMCLELESCKNGGDVFVKPCDGGKDQQWAWSGKTGKRQVRPKNCFMKCLDIQSGGNVFVWDCSKKGNTQFNYWRNFPWYSPEEEVEETPEEEDEDEDATTEAPTEAPTEVEEEEEEEEEEVEEEPEPAPGATCSVGDVVTCPDSPTKCAGDQCCPDRSTCPSASSTHVRWTRQEGDGGIGCRTPKKVDCTRR